MQRLAASRAVAGLTKGFVLSGRVGIGLDNETLRTIREKLKDNWVDAKTGRVPRCYRITGSKEEKPNLWVKDPTKSLVLQVSQQGHRFNTNPIPIAPTSMQHPSNINHTGSLRY
jgi:ATP-dependent DNA ligase